MSTASIMTTTQVLGAALDAAHHLLEETLSGVDDAIANRAGPGRANGIGASYAHAVLAEDACVNAMLRGQTPLWTGEWAGRTGTDRPVVISGAPFPGTEPGDLGAWYREVRIDLSALRAYAQAVAAASAAFIRAADDTTLARTIDLSFIGMGAMPLAATFEIFVTAHLNNVCGEISAVKGAFGLQGYPF
jgi:hypothetical protein